MAGTGKAQMEIQDRLVSIIVPVYNAGFYIEETIAMVRSQTYENWWTTAQRMMADGKSRVSYQKIKESG